MNTHLDLAAEVVPRAEQHREVNTDLYYGGVVRHDIGGLHPGLFHRGILDRALDASCTVHGETAVEGFVRESDGFQVDTLRGRTKARDLLVCTNGYTGGSTPWLRRRVVPSRAKSLLLSRPTETMARLMPKGRMLGETRNIYHYYRPSPDGNCIIFGGRAGAGTDDPEKNFAIYLMGW